jgi:hypothetical protein
MDMLPDDYEQWLADIRTKLSGNRLLFGGDEE